jgi:hypothetical protein
MNSSAARDLAIRSATTFSILRGVVYGLADVDAAAREWDHRAVFYAQYALREVSSLLILLGVQNRCSDAGAQVIEQLATLEIEDLDARGAAQLLASLRRQLNVQLRDRPPSDPDAAALTICLSMLHAIGAIASAWPNAERIGAICDRCEVPFGTLIDTATSGWVEPPS